MKLRLKRVQKKSHLGTGIIFRHSVNILTETPEMKIPYVLPYPSITIRECNIHTFRVVDMTGHLKSYANNLTIQQEVNLIGLIWWNILVRNEYIQNSQKKSEYASF